MANDEYEIIIVGAGPAGLSAGVFVARQRAKCLIISKDLGGQLNLIPKLENYPGTLMSSGPLLARTLENQYLSFHGDMIYDTVEKIEEVEGSSNLRVKTLRSEYTTKSVVLAAGKVPNNLGVDNETTYQNKGVHYCTKCDAPFYQGRTTATVVIFWNPVYFYLEWLQKCILYIEEANWVVTRIS
jgi:thioredoxin reductase